MDAYEVQPIENILPDFLSGKKPTQQEFREFIQSSYNRHIECVAATTTALNAGKTGNIITASSNGSFQIGGVTYGVNSVILVRHGLATYQGVYIVTTAGNGSTPYVLTRHQAFDTDDRIHNLIVTVRDSAYSSLFKITVNAYDSAVSGQLNTSGVTVTDFSNTGLQELFPYRAYANLDSSVAITQGNNASVFSSNGLSIVAGYGTPAFEYNDSLGAFKVLTGQEVAAQFAFNIAGDAGDIVRFVVEGTGVNSTTFDQVLMSKHVELGGSSWDVEVSFTHFMSANTYYRLKVYAISGDVIIDSQVANKNDWESYKATMIPISVSGGGGGGGETYTIGTGGAIDLASNKVLNSFVSPHTSQPTWTNAANWLDVAHVAMFIQLNTNLQPPLITEGSIKWKMAKATNAFVVDAVNMLDIVKKGDTVTIGIHNWANDAAITTPQITGGTNEGDTLTASYQFVGAGTLQNVTYQWKLGGANIGGATSATYSAQTEAQSISVEIGGEQVLGGVVIPLTPVVSSGIVIGASGGGSEVVISVWDSGYTGTPTNTSPENGSYVIPGSNQTQAVRLLSIGNKIQVTHNLAVTGNYLIKMHVRTGNAASTPTNYQNAYILRITPFGETPVNKSLALFDNEVTEHTGTVVGTIVWGNIITTGVENLPAGSTVFEIEANAGYPAGVIDEIVLIPQ